ncbi:hypothetical protein BD560DRAFT_488906 [Blakeslea trispora]|nr:hypothetical protein BD560DRAFT_488906 [Blakeslea trispora]
MQMSRMNNYLKLKGHTSKIKNEVELQRHISMNKSRSCLASSDRVWPCDFRILFDKQLMHRPSTPKSFHSLRLPNNPALNTSLQSKSTSQPNFNQYHSRSLYRQHSKSLEQEDQSQFNNTHQANQASHRALQRIPLDPSDSSSDEEFIDESDESDSSINQSESTLYKKIADLKIENKSLITINKVLESTVRQQAKHVASLQEYSEMNLGRNDLLPRTYIFHGIEYEQNDQLDRLRKKTEMMIEEGQRALAYQVGAGDCVLASNGDHYPLLRSSNTPRKRVLHQRSHKRLK